MNNRERMRAVLAGQYLDVVPSWTMSFFNVATIRRLIPPELMVDDLGMWPDHGAYGFEPHTEQELCKLVAFNRYIDRVAIGVGRGANHAFGHAGPGEFNTRVVAHTPTHNIIEYETGARAKVNFEPHFYHVFASPVKDIADIERLSLPDPEDPARWQGFAQDVVYLKSQGEYTVGYINGFFSGCHYFFCDYQEFLMSLVLNHELVARLTQILGDWNLKAAKRMLEAGIDCIAFVDDLGSENAMLFRPELYDRFFFPWHAALCDLAHSYGAHVHMHSHGNINRILGRIVDTGIDMINPLDPTEGMDLATIKEKYGRRVTLVGGMDKFIFEQDMDEIERRLQRALKIGSPNGRFILMDTGGIPETFPKQKFDQFLAVSRRLRTLAATR